MSNEEISQDVFDLIKTYYFDHYNPEHSLHVNGFDSLDIAELEMQLVHRYKMKMENWLKPDMSLDYIVKVIEQQTR